jgi:hypothetical protein
VDEDRAVVQGLLHRAGLEVPEPDISAMIQSYGATGKMIELLYAVDEAGEEWPALRFTAVRRAAN